MATLPQTPASSASSTLAPQFSHGSTTLAGPIAPAPASVGSSNNTYTLAASPMKPNRRPAGSVRPNESYKPTVMRTCGQKPACLVNASVTYCGNNQIYAFGGFDQYTDEVYNHVLKLDLNSLQWSLVDNYGAIPGVRMGHTACLWQGSKLLVHGGENEHRDYLSDVIVFDLKTAWWTQPKVRGPIPIGRARHASAVYDDKLFIHGGLSGPESTPLDDICYLDLKTWTWSRAWSFVCRFDHSAWVWGGRMWVYGGFAPDMERNGELWWLDLKSSPAFKSAPSYGNGDNVSSMQRPSSTYRPSFSQFNQQTPTQSGGSGYAANSSSIQVRNTGCSRNPVAPGAISSIKFVSGPNVPVQASGTHFHVYSSGAMLDFVTPGEMSRLADCSLSALDLDSLQWQTLVNGSEIFDPGYRWSYCAINEDGTKAWLLGYQEETQNGEQGSVEEYLSEILSIDLTKYGLLGNLASIENRNASTKIPASDRHQSSPLAGLSADLSAMFDQPPESGMGSDFIVTAEKDYEDGEEIHEMALTQQAKDVADESIGMTTGTSRPIHVHKLILQARWPHFARVYAAQMAEFHTRKMHIPEPYSVVRAFIYYLYTDSIARHDDYCPGLDEVAGLLVMASIYDMPRLRLLCVHRLSRELDVESAAIVWERAGVAGEEWLQKRAAMFCLVHWGRIVRSEGFRRLNRTSLMELCEIIDVEGRVVGGEELEAIGGLGGGRLGGLGPGGNRVMSSRRHESFGADATAGDEMEDMDGEEDENMQIT